MTQSIQNDTQPAAKLTCKRRKSTPEKRRTKTANKQRERSAAGGTAKEANVREKDRLAKRHSCASKENTPPPSPQESTPIVAAMTAMPSPQRRPMTVVTTAVSAPHHPQPLAAFHTPCACHPNAPQPAAMTDSCAMPVTASHRTTARKVQPTTANDTALVARDPAETNSLRIVTRSRTRDVAAETAKKDI
jgi:hypothetical protein